MVQIYTFVWKYMILTSSCSAEKENWIPTCPSFLPLLFLHLSDQKSVSYLIVCCFWLLPIWVREHPNCSTKGLRRINSLSCTDRKVHFFCSHSILTTGRLAHWVWVNICKENTHQQLNTKLVLKSCQKHHHLLRVIASSYIMPKVIKNMWWTSGFLG